MVWGKHPFDGIGASHATLSVGRSGLAPEVYADASRGDPAGAGLVATKGGA